MRSLPDSLSTDVQPPLRIPLAHVLVGLAFLLGGSVVAVATVLDATVAGGWTAVAHLLLVGWVCVTILGAMTQFVPVWSGVSIHSRSLAVLQLALATIGVTGLAGSFLFGTTTIAASFGIVLFAGFLAFCYNVGRTLLRARPWDVTELHFAFALGCFATATAIGTSLVLDYQIAMYPIELPAVVPGVSGESSAIGRVDAIDAHVTLAVFGGVVATIVGALYQLGPMFTQSEPTSLDRTVRRIEAVSYPVGVVGLTVGRLLENALVATVGGLCVALGVAFVCLSLARRLQTSTVGYSPMLPRYAIVAVLGVGWAATAGYAWTIDPLAVSARFGAPTLGTVLLLLTIGVTVVGSLYHIVPFLIWLHQYSDRIGYEPVPMIDDLYDDRLERTDLAATVVGTAALVVGTIVAVPLVWYLGGALLIVGIGIFITNVSLTIAVHAPAVVDPRSWRIDPFSSFFRE